jgi:murein DD-endopeptidase MepM/ murein hydrolase activator NlpD
MKRTILSTLLISLMAASKMMATGDSLDLILPTNNDGIYRGALVDFYQKTVGGDSARTGGEYGFVRNVRGTKEGSIFTRFHEGIDIKPLYRDAKGRPLDSVMTIDDGVVVHVQGRPGKSNYGRYVVVEHSWGGSPYYSLYAHLNEAWVDSGQVVSKGEPLGRLGYTGVGINKTRAHLHFEIGLLLNSHYSEWYSLTEKDSNFNGKFNGHNLAGIDVASFYLMLRDKPNLSVPEFLSIQPAYFTVAVPRIARPDLLDRYPWMLRRSADATDKSWLISFTRDGLPLSIEPSADEVSEPAITWIENSAISYGLLTKSLVGGANERGTLSRNGRKYIDMIVAAPEEMADEMGSK